MSWRRWRMLIAGREVEGIGLGTAQFAFRDGTAEDSVATVHAALDAGVMLIDTALAYTRPGVESYAEAGRGAGPARPDRRAPPGRDQGRALARRRRLPRRRPPADPPRSLRDQPAHARDRLYRPVPAALRRPRGAAGRQ